MNTFWLWWGRALIVTGVIVFLLSGNLLALLGAACGCWLLWDVRKKEYEHRS